MAGISTLFGAAKADASFWQPLNHPATFSAGVSLLLTDGTVFCQDAGTNNWWRLIPSSTGSYVDGTWKQAASMPTSYSPLYFASAVLPDGRVVVLGGEYINFNAVWSKDGYIYDPASNTWTHCPGPASWNNVGDAQCVVLPDGTFMVANILNGQTATLNATTLTWTVQPGTGKRDRNDEEGWTLLPNGKILTVDAIGANGTEIYDPATQVWSFAGNTPDRMSEASSQELGPALLRPNGTVLQIGAMGANDWYDIATGTWHTAAHFPGTLDEADGPACLLPNGNVFCCASPGVFNSGAHYFEFDLDNNLHAVPDHPDAAGQSSFFVSMLMLPTGQVFVTQFDGNVQIYNPDGAPQDAWRPTITACPNTLDPGVSYTLTGTQLNGMSQCNGYGDDFGNASNYPLVRVTSLLTGKVTYLKTFNFSTMGVATGALPVTTQFKLPPRIGGGPAKLEVVTNGIVSNSWNVAIRSASLL